MHDKSNLDTQTWLHLVPTTGKQRWTLILMLTKPAEVKNGQRYWLLTDISWMVRVNNDQHVGSCWYLPDPNDFASCFPTAAGPKWLALETNWARSSPAPQISFFFPSTPALRHSYLWPAGCIAQVAQVPLRNAPICNRFATEKHTGVSENSVSLNPMVHHHFP